MAKGKSATARAVALVGPTGAGKTTLLEALAFAAGATSRQGNAQSGFEIADSAPEARVRQSSVELNAVAFVHDGDRYTLVDLPGACDFAAEADTILPAMDIAIVVCDPSPDKAQLLQPLLAELDRIGLPRMIFVNKIDTARARLRDLLDALAPVSTTPVVARQIPIWDGEKAVGYVDLALERAYVYRNGEPSARIDMPGTVKDREAEARFSMLERLADYDDALMEQLLEDREPATDLVFADLVRETRERLITPLFLGSSQNGAGVRRLLKALRHDTPEPHHAAKRLHIEGPSLYVMKCSYAGAAGRQTMARVFGGRLIEGAELRDGDDSSTRLGGLGEPLGGTTRKIDSAGEGQVVTASRMDGGRRGEILALGAKGVVASARERPPLFAAAVFPKDRKDDVRLTQSLARLTEEDGGLSFAMNPETHELVLGGQGEGHLRVTLERLKRRYGVEVDSSRPQCAYKETISSETSIRGRHKKQSGGHGQFGDVVLQIAPLPRGAGFQFEERIHGGVVPRQYIPAVEAGVRDGLARGPLGFPVVDVSVTLVDGSHHAVDSSEIAFRTAGRIAIQEGLALCAPVLLEPIERLEIETPSTATAKITSLLAGRRGQILGFDAHPVLARWDVVEAYLPQAERLDLILELRSLTQGLAVFRARLDHMAELSGRLAEEASRGRHAA